MILLGNYFQTEAAVILVFFLDLQFILTIEDTIYPPKIVLFQLLG